MTSVDASQHIRLCHRVIGQMGLPEAIADEAFSESLIYLTEAAETFDPTRNVPVASWLANNVRWKLRNWLRTHKPTVSIDQIETDRTQSAGQFRAGISLKHAIARDGHSDTLVEYEDLLSKLTERERVCLLSEVYGYPGIEVAKRLGITAVAVSRAKSSARKKMKDEIIRTGALI